MCGFGRISRPFTTTGPSTQVMGAVRTSLDAARASLGDQSSRNAAVSVTRIAASVGAPRPFVRLLNSHPSTRRRGLLRERHSARPGSVERMGWLAGYVAYRSFRPAARARAPPRATTPKRPGVARQKVPFCENQRVRGSGAGGRRRRWGPGLGVCVKNPQDSSALARRPLPPPNFPPVAPV